MLASVNCADHRKKDRNQWDEEYVRTFQCADDKEKMEMFEETPDSPFCAQMKIYVPRAILASLILLMVYAPLYHFIISDKYKSGSWMIVHHIVTYLLVCLVVVNLLACIFISFWDSEKPKLRIKRDPNSFFKEQRTEIKFYD